MIGWNLGSFKDLAAAIQSVVTSIAVIVGGIWAFRRFILQREHKAHLQIDIDARFVGLHRDEWITEVLAIVENKSTVRHTIQRLDYEVRALSAKDVLTGKPTDVQFPQELAKGNWFPKNWTFFFVEPGVRSDYVCLLRIPSHVAFILLDAWMSYDEKPEKPELYWSRKVLPVPSVSAMEVKPAG